MKLSVYVLGREVAVLESAGDFKSILTYLPSTAVEDFVSLTMPVRTESWVWLRDGVFSTTSAANRKLSAASCGWQTHNHTVWAVLTVNRI